MQRHKCNTVDMRLLLDSSSTHAPGRNVDAAALADLYVAPARRWLRANFVATLDGAANGPDDRSGSINTEADHVVFDLLRRLTDVVVVGAGTVRAEGYPSLRAEDPRARCSWWSATRALCRPAWSTARSARSTCSPAREPTPRPWTRPASSSARSSSLTAGKDAVDFVKMRNMLEDKGYRQILCEGGPSLLNSMLAAGVVDELDLTWSPVLVGGNHPTITRGPNLNLPASPTLLLEEDGTILGRWFVNR